ncbi:MAG: hypothetical protein ACJA2G_000435, partial [Cognaticolwellia sp.]
FLQGEVNEKGTSRVEKNLSATDQLIFNFSCCYSSFLPVNYLII